MIAGIQGTHTPGSDGAGRWTSGVPTVGSNHAAGSVRSSVLRRTSGTGHATAKRPRASPVVQLHRVRAADSAVTELDPKAEVHADFGESWRPVGASRGE